jgi:hypothetical protein
MESEEIHINALEIVKGVLSSFKADWFAWGMKKDRPKGVPTNTTITKLS